MRHIHSQLKSLNTTDTIKFTIYCLVYIISCCDLYAHLNPFNISDINATIGQSQLLDNQTFNQFILECIKFKRCTKNSQKLSIIIMWVGVAQAFDNGEESLKIYFYRGTAQLYGLWRATENSLVH